MKKIIKKLNLNKFYSLFDILSDNAAVKLQHYLSVGRPLNLDNPVRFSDKIHWYKLNYKNDIMTKCADKFLMREYIEGKGLADYLPKIYNSFDTMDEIEFEKLPTSFAIKCNNGSGTNMFITNRDEVDQEKFSKIVKSWIKVNTLSIGREWAYKNIKQKIVVEELLLPEDEFQKKHGLNDYKVLCFNGEPKYVWVDVSRHTNHQRNFYDLNWKFINVVTDKPNSTTNIKKPKYINEMIRISKEISKDFPFVRVDFYELNDSLYIGELTFYPWSGCIKFSPDQFDYELGNNFIINNIKGNNKND